MRINTVPRFNPQAVSGKQPSSRTTTRFGGGTTPSFLLKAFDFHKLGQTAIVMNMLIYGSVISSRIAMGRSRNEKLEITRRDCLGWYTWFILGHVIQSLVALSLSKLPFIDKQVRELLLTRPSLGNPKWYQKYLLWPVFQPQRLIQIASDTQLDTRLQQYKKLATEKMSNTLVLEKDLVKVRKIFTQARAIRGALTATGLAFTIFTLGYLINKLNIIWTRNNLIEEAKKKRQSHNPWVDAYNAYQKSQQALWAKPIANTSQVLPFNSSIYPGFVATRAQ